MYYKLLRVEEPKYTQAWYFRTFVYECEKCHREYTRHACNNRISPLCGTCSRELDKLKAREKYLAKQAEVKKLNQRIKELEDKLKEVHKDVL